MMKQQTLFLLLFFAVIFTPGVKAEHTFNGQYSGRNLDRVAFPIGGIGAGMFCLEGTGVISHVSVRNEMNFFNEPPCFAAVCVLGDSEEKNVARLLEGPIPDWKYFGRPNTGNGAPGTTYGLPRFKECSFQFRFPFATINLKDKSFPLEAELLGWSPFTPGDPDSSSRPVGAIEYRLTNTSNKPQKAIFTFNSPNFMRGGGSIGPIEDGFVLFDETGETRTNGGGFAFYVLGDSDVLGEGGRIPNVKVDHCWFRGGWWDPLTIAWDNVQKGRIIDNPPVELHAPGATIHVPLALAPGQSQVVRLLMTWYVPTSGISIGTPPAASSGPAFGAGPAPGTAKNQNPVRGFLGKKLVNTFYPSGDGATGTLTSPTITLNKKYIHFLLGGGSGCPAQLIIDGKVVRSAAGRNEEYLNWTTWDVAEFAGKEARIKLVDEQTGGWGHINADHFIMSDEPIAALRTGKENEISTDPGRVVLIADFEGSDYGNWVVEQIEKQKDNVDLSELVVEDGEFVCEPGSPCCPDGKVPTTYVPWYACQHKSIYEVADFWKERYEELKHRSRVFADTFYDSTLPPEVIEAVAANLSILKSPTVLRQHDGKLWCWEGCHDGSGCCAGTCTHVWNYAQAICHLFPSLERSLRHTEYFAGTDESGRQAFRANLPVFPGGVAFDASDGQLGGIMKAYREWKIGGDDEWLRKYWPRITLSLDFMIKTWDPRHTGLLEEDHHNTYDINYFGPDGHCGSFYLGALQATVEMGTVLGENVDKYKELLEKGKKRMVADLYNGEYFIQIVMKEGLDRNFHPINPNDQSAGYRKIAEMVNQQGAKYQYGTGCLSDGVLGLWIAKTAGIDADIIDPKLVKSHLLAIYKHNFRNDLSEHSNPQRPTYAMGDDAGLLLCTWPNGGKPLLPFVYSDEVWTGIEYQVASHLMFHGCVSEGLEIVKAVRKRHDGTRRNPLNEYECGHWYARAMSSYGLLQGLTGVRYDALTKTLYVNSQVGDFRSFLSTETGFGTVKYTGGKATLDVKWGTIPVERTVVKK
ncbi:MAG: non-lysosomal glucosylceramidase [Planctomycetaceae bacterium]|nr:non-lysosomal glucosylceramidase [Planctomycetaceae bacterium]